MDYSELTIAQVARVLWNRRMVLIATAFTAALCGFLIAGLLPRIYTAIGLVVVEPRKVSIDEMGVGLTSTTMELTRIQTEADILRSRAMIENLVKDLDLASNPAILKPVESGSFNLANMVETAKIWLTSLLPEGWMPAPEVIQPDLNAAAADVVQLNLAISAREKSAAIPVAYSNEDPVLAATIVNRLMEIYIAEQIRSRSEIGDRVTSQLSDQQDRLWAEVVDADKRVQEYQAKHGLLQARGTALSTNRVDELQSQLTAARNDESRLAASVTAANRALARGNAAASTEVLASPLIQRLREQEAMVLRTFSNLSRSLGQKHPQVVAQNQELIDIRGQIDREVAKIVSALQGDLQLARSRVVSINRDLATASTLATRAASAEVGLQQLVKEAEAKRMIYQTYLERVDQTTVAQNSRLPDVRIASTAVTPTQITSPNRKVITAFAGIAGLCLAAAGTLLTNNLRGRVTDSAELARLTGFASLGDIPLIPRRSGAHFCDAVMTAPQLAAAESIRGLWAGLRTARDGWNPKVVLVTSGLPGEGKTSLISALGRLAALDGARVLIIDADFRMPMIGQVFGRTSSSAGQPCVDELLASGEHLEGALKVDNASGVFYLPARGSFSNPQALLGSSRFGSLIADACTNFDLVLLDSPPVLRVSDSVMLARRADAIVLVAKSNSTLRSEAVEAARRLRIPGGSLAFSVVSGVPAKAASNKYYAGYRRLGGGVRLVTQNGGAVAAPERL